VKLDDHNFSFLPGPDGWEFWHSQDCPEPSTISQCVQAGLSSAVEVFKEDGKRWVYRLSSGIGQQFIVKTNLLPRLKDKFRARSFAPEELTCHLQAVHRGIPAPKVYAFFSRRKWGLTVQNGLIIEYLQNFRALANTETLRMLPAFVMLYQKGINHPDFMHRNFMLNDDAGCWEIIDLEKCAFLASPSLLSLLLMLARNVEYGELGISHPVNQSLIQELYPALGEIKLSYQNFQRAIEIIASKHRSSKDRQRIAFPAELQILCDKSLII